MNVLAYIAIAIISYLLGSISSGLLVSKALHGPNLREVGSKNTGASNALRAMGAKGGFATFVGDIIKALIACLIGRAWMGMPGVMVAGIFVILGHNWPIFFQFKGGKGVSSMTAIMLVSFWWQAIICYVVTIAVIALTRFISLGSMVMVTLFAILVTATNWGNWTAILWAVFLAAVCIWRHRGNIVRLLNGTEAKIGQRVK